MRTGGFMKNNKENKLNKIGKKELLETLIAQKQRIEELETELEKTNKKLESKKITIEESGSIAKAALELNKIFEVAQKSADDYIENVKDKCKKLEAKTKKECQKMTEEAEKLLNEVKIEKEKLAKKKENKTKKSTVKKTSKTKTINSKKEVKSTQKSLKEKSKE